jgi:hypothetical protein
MDGEASAWKRVFLVEIGALWLTPPSVIAIPAPMKINAKCR